MCIIEGNQMKCFIYPIMGFRSKSCCCVTYNFYTHSIEEAAQVRAVVCCGVRPLPPSWGDVTQVRQFRLFSCSSRGMGWRGGVELSLVMLETFLHTHTNQPLFLRRAQKHLQVWFSAEHRRVSQHSFHSLCSFFFFLFPPLSSIMIVIGIDQGKVANCKWAIGGWDRISAEWSDTL